MLHGVRGKCDEGMQRVPERILLQHHMPAGGLAAAQGRLQAACVTVACSRSLVRRLVGQQRSFYPAVVSEGSSHAESAGPW